MKCVYCKERAGLLKRVCRDCSRLVDVTAALENAFGYRQLLDTLLETKIDPQKIEKYLDADVDGRGSINDQITARMTNQIMHSLGTPSQMSGKDVLKVRHDIAEGRAPSLTDCEVTDYAQLPQKPENKS